MSPNGRYLCLRSIQEREGCPLALIPSPRSRSERRGRLEANRSTDDERITDGGRAPASGDPSTSLRIAGYVAEDDMERDALPTQR